jgi:hypothetical protein
MPTFGECIVDGVASGAIAPEIGEAARQAYQNAYADAAQTLGPEEADRQAGAAVLDALEKAKIEARRRQALAIRARRRALDDIAAQKRRRGYSNVPELGGSDGKPPPGGPKGWTQGGEPPKDGPLKSGAVAAKTLPLMLRNKAGLSGYRGVSAEGQALAIKGLFDADMAAVMEKMETRTGFDTPNRALMANILRECFGEDTGDKAAKLLAAAWMKTSEMARQMFNAAGGAIGKLDKWGLPQQHDAAAIYRAGKAAWIRFTAPLLNRAKMVDKLTGAPLTMERLTAPDGVLSQIYDRIVTHGLIDAYPPDHPGAGAMALTRGEERFLAFDGADNWAKYQQQFGQGDAYAAMMSHLDGMAHDIALMRVFGPNPTAQFTWLKAFAEREAALERLHGNAGAVDTAARYINRAQNMWDHFTGKASLPVDTKVAAIGGGIRNYLNGVDLGSAILSDMPSAPMFGALARSFMGVKLQGDMGQLGALLADPEMRGLARRSGFINEVARDGLIGVTQDSLRSMTAGERTASGMNTFARKLPSAVMRLQGLSGMFEARRRSFRLSFMGALADAAPKTLAELGAGSAQEKALAAELANRGFTDADWDKVRATPAWNPRAGVEFLRPQDIAAHAGQDLGLRVGEMVLNGEQYAVPVSGSLWTRSALLHGRPGTVMGELTRSFTMFKTFAVNMAYQYGEEIFLRGVERGLSGWGLNGYMAKWAAGIFGGLTLSGAVSLQLKRLTLGEDPLPMNTPEFWGAAMLQGGGLGILGDFFFSRTARNEKSGPIVAMGPTGQLASDAFDLTAGEAMDQVTASKHPRRHDAEPRRIAHDLSAYVPGASLWWARLAYNRLIVDQLEQAADPSAKQRYAQAAKAAMTQTGAGAWWPRGSALPQRAPDVAHLMAARDASHP